MGKVRDMRRKAKVLNLKEKRLNKQGNPPDVRQMMDDLSVEFSRGWRMGYYEAAKDCANAVKESSNIRKAREQVNGIAHRARLASDA